MAGNFCSSEMLHTSIGNVDTAFILSTYAMFNYQYRGKFLFHYETFTVACGGPEDYAAMECNGPVGV